MSSKIKKFPIVFIFTILVFFGSFACILFASADGVYSFNGSTGVLTIGDTKEITADKVNYAVGNDKSAIKSVKIEGRPTIIGNEVFANCTNLLSFTIPDSVTNIGMDAFRGCSKLIKITIPNGVTTVDSCAFGDCTCLAIISLPDSAVNISCDAFENTAYSNNSLNWKNDILYIDNFLMEAKDEISGDCTIKSGIKNIANFAFDDCSNLTGITIPESVTYIGMSAFTGCTNLKNVYYTGTGEKWSKIIIEYNNYDLTGCPILYECNSKNSYYGKGDCGLNSTWILNSNGELVISGSGEISFCLWGDCKEKINKLKIDGQITGICDGAFSNCANLKDIYYAGTEENWNKISINLNNDSLNSATKHFYCSDSNHNFVNGKCTNDCCWFTCSHNFGEWKVTKEASFFKDGQKVRTCSVKGCGKTETAIIPSTLKAFFNSIKNFFKNLFSFSF
jgi:hypothetical protein